MMSPQTLPKPRRTDIEHDIVSQMHIISDLEILNTQMLMGITTRPLSFFSPSDVFSS